jgi:hypothetical protein
VTQPCPRPGCDNTLTGTQIVCTADFHALAGMCRFKKRLGQPTADWVASRGRGVAYRCELCRDWHNGGAVQAAEVARAIAEATVQTLCDDPRVGWRGLLKLADAWDPERTGVNRSRWAEGIDQREALAAP